MKLPVVAPAGRAVLSWSLDEAVVQAEIVTNGVLPSRPMLAVVRELLNDVIINLSHRQHLTGGVQYRHSDESDVRVRRFDVLGIGFKGRGSLPATSLCQRWLRFGGCSW